MIKRLIIFVLVFLLHGAMAAPNALPTHKLRVGVVLQMPFSQNIDGHYSGIAIDIWETIANSHNWDYTYVPLTLNVTEELKKLGPSGDLDVVIGPISVNMKRLQIVDFTRPFFISSVNIITKHHELDFLDVTKSFLTDTLLFSLAILGGSFILFISIIRYIEKGKLAEVFTHYFNAFTKGIWFHLFRKGMSVPKTFYASIMHP